MQFLKLWSTCEHHFSTSSKLRDITLLLLPLWIWNSNSYSNGNGLLPCCYKAWRSAVYPCSSLVVLQCKNSSRFQLLLVCILCYLPQEILSLSLKTHRLSVVSYRTFPVFSPRGTGNLRHVSLILWYGPCARTSRSQSSVLNVCLFFSWMFSLRFLRVHKSCKNVVTVVFSFRFVLFTFVSFFVQSNQIFVKLKHIRAFKSTFAGELETFVNHSAAPRGFPTLPLFSHRFISR